MQKGQTYRLLGVADENKATDMSALLTAVESIAVTTGAAVAMATHFTKGNVAAKESIDRISGSGVLAQDPDSLVTFTRHEEDGAFTLEMTLRNLPPVQPFVVKWGWPLFRRAENLDPGDLKQNPGRPANYSREQILHALGEERRTGSEWLEETKKACAISRTRFYEIVGELSHAGKVAKSVVDDKRERIQRKARISGLLLQPAGTAPRPKLAPVAEHPQLETRWRHP